MTHFTMTKITQREASEPGALPHYGCECSCGTTIRSTILDAVRRDAVDHIRWHERNGDAVEVPQ